MAESLANAYWGRPRTASTMRAICSTAGPVGQLHQLAEFRTAAHEGITGVGRRQPTLQQSRTATQRPSLQRPLNPEFYLVQRARLADVVESPQPDRFDGCVDGAMAGEHDDLAV